MKKYLKLLYIIKMLFVKKSFETYSEVGCNIAKTL